MRGVTTKYTSSDPGALPINGLVGSFIALLKDILIGTNGLTSSGKPACGWTLEFEDTSDPSTHIAVFRNNAVYGEGCYLRILETAQTVRANVYEDMTDVSTGTGGCRTDDGVYVYKSTTANNVARRYVFAGDHRTLIGNILFGTGESGAAAGPQMFYFGDFNRIDGVEKGIFLAGTITSNGPNTGFQGVTNLTSFKSSSYGNTSAPTNYPTGYISRTKDGVQPTSAYPDYSHMWINSNNAGGPGSIILTSAGSDSPMSLPEAREPGQWIRFGVIDLNRNIIGYLRGIWVPYGWGMTTNNLYFKYFNDTRGGFLSRDINEITIIRSISRALTGTNNGSEQCFLGVETKMSWDQ